MENKRKKYIIATIVLLIIEVFIALFIRGNFVREYIGDLLVVGVIYTFIRSFIPQKIKTLPVLICIFAIFVEFMQLINIVEILGLDKDGFLGIVIGSTFDIKDLICYVIGCVMIYLFENTNCGRC